MTMNIQCPTCNEQLEAPDNAEGQVVQCPACNGKLVVPKRMMVAHPKAHPDGIPSVNSDSVPPVPEEPSVSPTSSTQESILPRTSGMAIASMILGIVGLVGGWLCCGPLFPILAIIFGHISYSKIAKDPLKYTGKGFAIAGFTMGYVGLALGLVALILVGTQLTLLQQMTQQVQTILGVHR